MAYVGNNLTVQQYAPQIAYFNGNGSTVAFTLPIAVVSAAQIIVAIENVIQNPSSAYSVSGTTLTFTSAPPSGSSNIWVEYTSLQTNTVVPSAGTVGQAQLSSPTGTGFPVLQTSPTLTTPTLTSPTMTGAVVSSMASSVLTSGTAVASTSGTSIDFTGIPSWVKRVTVAFQGVSGSGASNFQIQLGAGSVTTTGYIGAAVFHTSGAIGAGNYTSGLVVQNATDASVLYSGIYTFVTLGSNKWVGSGAIEGNASAYGGSGTASITLGGTLDRIRITTVNGTDTFDAGTINILYE